MNVDSIVLGIIAKMNGLQSLRDLDTVFTVDLGCIHMRETINAWRTAIEEDIRGIESFVAYL